MVAEFVSRLSVRVHADSLIVGDILRSGTRVYSRDYQNHEIFHDLGMVESVHIGTDAVDIDIINPWGEKERYIHSPNQPLHIRRKV